MCLFKGCHFFEEILSLLKGCLKDQLLKMRGLDQPSKMVEKLDHPSKKVERFDWHPKKVERLEHPPKKEERFD